MTASRLTLALLCLAPLTLAAAPYLGSPWPGVALAALALVPWVGSMLGDMRAAKDQAEDMAKRLEAMEEDVRSLKNRITMKAM